MIDIKILRENPGELKKAAKAKGCNVDKVIDDILKLDQQRRDFLVKVESLRKEKNLISQNLKGKPSQKNIEKSKKIKSELSKLEAQLKNIEEKLNENILVIPNPAAPDVQIGQYERENEVLRHVGSKPKFGFKIKDHVELGESLDLIDLERAAKIAGSRFFYLKNELVILEFSLIRWVLDMLVKEGFSPVITPDLIKGFAMRGMGYIEMGDKDETYYLEQDDQFLTATSEQAIGPMYTNETLNEKDLPKRYVGFSSCFRREAGSYGKDVRGIFRVHQFDKLEMFSFTKPEESDKENYYFLELEEKFMKALELPYQVIKMVTGDLGFPAARKFDIETWIPSQEKYRETHSTSTATDFQARRLNMRYKDKAGKVNYMHTVNGTALAMTRTIIAIMENYQQKDGSIFIPKVLQEYIGIKEIKPKG